MLQLMRDLVTDVADFMLGSTCRSKSLRPSARPSKAQIRVDPSEQDITGSGFNCVKFDPRKPARTIRRNDGNLGMHGAMRWDERRRSLFRSSSGSGPSGRVHFPRTIRGWDKANRKLRPAFVHEGDLRACAPADPRQMNLHPKQLRNRSRFESHREGWLDRLPARVRVRIRRVEAVWIDRPCLTIRKSHMGWKPTIDGKQRQFSREEAKTLQSFPESFSFSGNYYETWQRLGNSVPPLFMMAISIYVRQKILSGLISIQHASTRGGQLF